MRIPIRVVTNCDGCGACCTGQAALPVSLINPRSGERPVSPLPDYLIRELTDYVHKFMAEGWPADNTPCIWYCDVTRQCKHYNHRPELCRDAVKPGDQSCLSWRRDLGIDPKTKYIVKNGRLTTV